METRFLLPLFVVATMVVVAPGWRLGLRRGDAGLRRLAEPLVLGSGFAAFMVIAWLVVSAASRELRFV